VRSGCGWAAVRMERALARAVFLRRSSKSITSFHVVKSKFFHFTVALHSSSIFLVFDLNKIYRKSVPSPGGKNYQKYS
jgi:hypothetical protein